MMNEPQAWAKDAVTVCRIVAGHELQGYGCYVVPQSKAPRWCRFNTLAAGWSRPRADLDLGLAWTGRGFACVVDDGLIVEMVHPGLQAQVFLGVALHELAHAVRGAWTWPDVYVVPYSPEETFQVALSLAGIAPDPEDGCPPWGHHEIGFLRVLSHLCARARAVGRTVGLWDAMGADLGMGMSAYGLSSPWKYEEAVADEAAAWLGRPLAEVLATPPPPALAELWERDTEGEDVRE